MPTPTDPAMENLTTSLRRVERQKRLLEEWTSTLERTVTAHERVARERQVEREAEREAREAEREAREAEREAEREAHLVELRVRAQELGAVEKRLNRTLESQSFRLGHLLVRMAVAPVKALRWMGRATRWMLIVVYRLAQRVLPGQVVDPLQRAATRGQVTTARRHEVLDLPGDRPVAFLDCRGLPDRARDEVWARVAASDQPARTVVLTDHIDFTGLRDLGLSFEYLPPYRAGTPWWSNEADHDRWVKERLTAMRLGYGVDDDH